jgi:hypothetical protein
VLACHRGVFVADELCSVREASIDAVFAFHILNLSNGEVTALVVRVSYEYGFEETNEVRSVGGGLSEGGRSSSGRTAGQEVRESGDIPSLTATRRVGMSWHGGGWQSKRVLLVMGGRRI